MDWRGQGLQDTGEENQEGEEKLKQAGGKKNNKWEKCKIGKDNNKIKHETTTQNLKIIPQKEA